VTLDPEIFFLLFLPPLLFLDGWRIPREELFKDGKTIVELALGLVIEMRFVRFLDPPIGAGTAEVMRIAARPLRAERMACSGSSCRSKPDRRTAHVGSTAAALVLKADRGYNRRHCRHSGAGVRRLLADFRSSVSHSQRT